MAKIWLLEIGEPLPRESAERPHFIGALARFLAENTQDHVTWWTSSFSHTPKRHFVEADTIDQLGRLKVIYLRGSGYKRNISLARIRHQQQFAQRFLDIAQQKDYISSDLKPDLIFTSVPTIDNAVAAQTLAQKIGVPFVVIVRDLWPDELRDLAPPILRPLAQQLFLRRAYKKMQDVCQKADGLLGISQSYLDYALQFSGHEPRTQDRVFPLGYTLPKLSDNELQKAQIWWETLNTKPNQFTVCFFGTIGQYFNLDTVIDVASILKTQNLPVQFILGGSGSRLAEYQKRAESVDNVIFPGWLNAAQMAIVMQNSQAALAPYKSDAKMSLPNKPFEYMAAGLPIIASIQGELKHLLASHHCGFNYQADDVSSLMQAILKLYSEPKLRAEMGNNSRQLFTQKFDQQVIFSELHDYLLELIKKRKDVYADPVSRPAIPVSPT